MSRYSLKNGKILRSHKLISIYAYYTRFAEHGHGMSSMLFTVKIKLNASYSSDGFLFIANHSRNASTLFLTF